MSASDEDAERTINLNPSELQEGVGAFLHGRLTVKVIEARDVEGTSGRFFDKVERIVTSSIDGVDPYCSVKLGYNKIMQTDVIQNSSAPEWNASATFDICHDFATLEFRLKAAKRGGALGLISKVKHLSMLSITAAHIAEQRQVSGWFPLGTYQKEVYAEGCDSDSGSESEDEDDTDHNHGELNIEVFYEPIAELTDFADVGLREAYFPIRKGIKVTMYQDADCPPGMLPDIPFKPDYRHARCWSELSRAIMASTEFIYITGWAVWPELVMVRTEHEDDEWNGLTLGEMLKQKAEEGVTVCVMVWDEYASGKLYKGLMGTHDEEVHAYFKKSKVTSIKVGRENAKDGPFADLNDSLMFTHHQKTVVYTRMDSETGRNRVEAFVGGLDLTDGRYDNPQHSLFRTLNTLHAPPDFWQACALGITAESGPREPWHDIHSHVTGTAAWDVLTNFEGRWARQAAEKYKDCLHDHSTDAIMQPGEEDELRDGDFNAQVIRSINEASTQFQEARPGLIAREYAKTDQSIHNAYIHNIRRAKSFIYFENQYFLGSSHMWNSGQRGGFSAHLIAIELAEKICAKIRANERFAAYVNIPMHSEGPPDSAAVQEILSHQRKTVNLITMRIAKTIEETGSDTKVSDWFNVFCIVNRESEEGGAGNGGSDELEQRFSQSRRFMVYLHSKFAIFDDTVAIIGSANINSRSMDGSRDTEIGVMVWQPDHIATGSDAYHPSEEETSIPQGDVAAFRASVWSEHMGGYHEAFENPASIGCISLVRELAEHNWSHFASDEPEAVDDMPHGHLALYPYRFDDAGEVINDSSETFPDYPNAPIKGRARPGIPNMLTG